MNGTFYVNVKLLDNFKLLPLQIVYLWYVINIIIFSILITIGPS